MHNRKSVKHSATALLCLLSTLTFAATTIKQQRCEFLQRPLESSWERKDGIEPDDRLRDSADYGQRRRVRLGSGTYSFQFPAPVYEASRLPNK